MKKMTLSAAMLALWGTAAFAADPFTLTSSSFKDGAMMDVKHAGATKTNPNCVGQNVSPRTQVDERAGRRQELRARGDRLGRAKRARRRITCSPTISSRTSPALLKAS